MDAYSNSSSSSNSPDSLYGLKFGQKLYFEDMGLALPTNPGSGLRSSAMADGDKAPGTQPKKRKGGNVQNGQPPSCQVEGCKADLTNVKAYYSKHRVCGMHSKSPKVIVADLEQRFCQQCSRFHQIPEFDQGKRSCRRRLAGHNERRRKPPIGTLLSSRDMRLPSSVFGLETIYPTGTGTGSFLMDFSAYLRLHTGSSTRNSGQLSENKAMHAGDKFFSHLWQGESHHENPPCNNNLLEGSVRGNCYSCSAPGECLASVVSDSSCALSLLSNQTSWCSRNQSLSTTGLPMVQSSSTVHVTTTINPFSDTTTWGLQGCEPWTSQFQGELDHLAAPRQQQQPMMLLYPTSSTSNGCFDFM